MSAWEVTKTLWKNTPVWLRLAWVSVGIAFVAFLATAIKLEAQLAKAKQLNRDAQRIAVEAQINKDHAMRADALVDALRSELALIKERVAQTNKVYAKIPKPRPVEAAPASDQALQDGLAQAGIREPIKNEEDARMVWDWNQAFIVLPQYQLKLSGCEQLVAVQAEQITKEEKLVASLTVSRDGWQAAAGLETKRADTLQARGDVLEKAVETGKKRTKWAAVGSFLLGLLASLLL